MTRVVNKHHGPPPPGSVYIGRPGKWGNPASHTSSILAQVRVATREAAVEYYREHLRSRPDLVEDARRELRGKVLVCFCKPQACHGDILARVADGGEI